MNHDSNMTVAGPSNSQDSASLVKRLAGPSVNKAGLAKDQTEINRIIAEVSKGSKFYDNEKRKDKELTERISKILKIKDNVVKEANIPLFESDSDRLLEELELERDLTQYIVHVDMDAFYASVELLFNPDLSGKPFGVGKGVLCTASYEARKYGVRSGMAQFVAKKLCPDLIIVSLDFKRYSEMSNRVMAIFREYDPTMIVAGCDEGYLNITKYCNEHGLTAENCVQEMRARVKAETNLTVSAGIAPNKMLAKICSDKNKPNGQFQLTFEKDSIKAFMHDLSIRKLPGVGRVNERLLESIGVKTCGDIYEHRATIWLLDHYFGKHFLFRAHLGIASNNVQPHTREETKSVGAERTFNAISDTNMILQKLEEVSIELENEMRKGGWAGKTVTLKYKLDTYQVFTRAKSFDRWITSKEDLFNTGKELVKPELPLCIRLIGLRVTKLRDLHVSADSGIKRFFHANTSSRPEPIVKRRKMSITEPIAVADEKTSITHYGEDSMPGFHEHVEGIESATILEETDIKEESNLESIEHAENPVVQATPAQSCPICNRIFDDLDNTAINTHLDFCLSKCAIKEATAEPPVPNHASPPKSRKKPTKIEHIGRKPGKNRRDRQTKLELG